jgi:hypothetical protein
MVEPSLTKQVECRTNKKAPFEGRFFVVTFPIARLVTESPHDDLTPGYLAGLGLVKCLSLLFGCNIYRQMSLSLAAMNMPVILPVSLKTKETT